MTNATFQVASIYKLPFDNVSFDLVWAHAVFEHLQSPKQHWQRLSVFSVQEVLSPYEALIGVDSTLSPESDALQKAIGAYENLQNARGGDVHAGRKLAHLLREAGFQSIKFSASYECYASAEFIGEYLAMRLDQAGASIMPALRSKRA